MGAEIRETRAESKPVTVDHKDGKPVHCKCCLNHNTIKLAMLRGSAFELRARLPEWFESLGAKEILSHAQSESDGNLSVSITYR